jgi:hypothetical protein
MRVYKDLLMGFKALFGNFPEGSNTIKTRLSRYKQNNYDVLQEIK